MAQNQAQETAQQETPPAQTPPNEEKKSEKAVETPQDAKQENSTTEKSSKNKEKGGEKSLLGAEELLDSLRKVREDVGQISELSSEEGKIVGALMLTFLRFMKPLMRAVPVDPSSLPDDMGKVRRANLVPEGLLIVQYDDGRMSSTDLVREENREILVKVVSNVIPKFNKTVEEHRQSIEKRMAFLTSVTKELQNISDAMAPEQE